MTDLRVRAVRKPVSVMSPKEATGHQSDPAFTLFCCLVQRVESRPAEMSGGLFFGSCSLGAAAGPVVDLSSHDPGRRQ